MSEIKDGGPAFPVEIDERIRNQSIGSGIYCSKYHNGMTLRDWFAGMALQGMLANHYKEGFGQTNELDYSRSSYVLADAMIRCREYK